VIDHPNKAYQVKLTPENCRLVSERVKKHKRSGLKVSKNAVANQVLAVGFKVSDKEHNDT